MLEDPDDDVALSSKVHTNKTNEKGLRQYSKEDKHMTARTHTHTHTQHTHREREHKSQARQRHGAYELR